MNANELIDELENIYWVQGDGKGKPFQQDADFIRQQQAEIERLTKENRDLGYYIEGWHKWKLQLQEFIK